jgi:hypothetical protein
MDWIIRLSVGITGRLLVYKLVASKTRTSLWLFSVVPEQGEYTNGEGSLAWVSSMSPCESGWVFEI